MYCYIMPPEPLYGVVIKPAIVRTNTHTYTQQCV